MICSAGKTQQKSPRVENVNLFDFIMNENAVKKKKKRIEDMDFCELNIDMAYEWAEW